jgi:hypothetical protein
MRFSKFSCSNLEKCGKDVSKFLFKKKNGKRVPKFLQKKKNLGYKRSMMVGREIF